MNGIDLMTRDDILNMPAGRELDLLIALKVMGWEHNSLGDAWIREGEPWVGCDEFQPSVDIAAAWEVHKNILNRLSSVRKIYFNELQRVVSKEYTESGNTLIAYPDVFIFVEPSHFCRAALLAVKRDNS